MGKKTGKALGIAVLLIAFLIASFNSLAATGLSILDTDASTYIVVVMLMLFLFICFSAKEDICLEYSGINVACAIAIFVAYMLLLSYARGALSSAFMSYRVDALLIPLFLLSIIVLLFGLSGVKKLLPLIVYSAFASPVILAPLLGLNGAFAGLNAMLVYGMMKGIGLQVARAGLLISSAAGSSISVSETCVSIGTFVAFVMFLVPLAYFYDGKLDRKVYWVVSGAALVLLLNLLRMTIISLVWASYGINEAISIFHAFAGQLIFYIGIIVMVLVAYWYGLRIEGISKGAIKEARTMHKAVYGKAAALSFVAIAFAVIAFALGTGYVHSLYAPFLSFSNGTVSSISLNYRMLEGLESSGNDVSVLSGSQLGDLFLLGNLSEDLNSSIYVVANISYSPAPYHKMPGYLPIGSAHSYILKNGVTATAQTVESGNSTFEINYFSVPYNITGSWVMVDYMLFENLNYSSMPHCSPSGYMNTFGYVESVLYNGVQGHATTGNGFVCQSYAIASST
ncbi:MAG: archaeosortase/exosortase family protein [Candidatus Micrarchaeaceae archaeon]